MEMGIDLDSLENWRERFLAGEFEIPGAAPERTAMYLGNKNGADRFVVPKRFNPGEPVRVLSDGDPIDPGDVTVKPATGGMEFTLIETKLGPKPEGALIVVAGPRGETYTGTRPPDTFTVVTNTTIKRGPSTTTIRVTPVVTSVDPGGNKTDYPGGESPPPGGESTPPGGSDPQPGGTSTQPGGTSTQPGGTSTQPGGTPQVHVKDGDGFFRTLFTLINVATSVAVPLGTAYLLRPTGTVGAVHSNPDGSTSIEVPNDVYDETLKNTQEKNPDFGNEDVANAFEAGLEQPFESTGSGLSVTSAFAHGCSILSLPPGCAVTFLTRGNGDLAPIFRLGSVRVDLMIDGLPAGCMEVQDAWMEPSGQGWVTAVLPPLLTSPSGQVEAVVRCGGAVSNPVLLGLEPGRVEVVALQTVVLSGQAVKVILTSTTGGPIKGTLVLTGPGQFVTGGTTASFDTWGTASIVVLTSQAGNIHLTFRPDTSGRPDDEMEALFETD